MSDPDVAPAKGARSARTAPGPYPPPAARRRAAALCFLRAAVVAVGCVTAYYLLPLDRPATVGTTLLLVGGFLAIALVFAWEVRTITRSAYPRLKAAEALAATLPLFLVLFASVYYLLDRSAPETFDELLTRTDALYFTLATFTTVGYGDITAHSQAGRVVTMLQMAGGLLVVGVAARVLAGAVEAGLRQRERRPGPRPEDAGDGPRPTDDGREGRP
ncbi:potassium channel family protein [Streptomyces sp. NPDC017936]|uniref:potassium channel family protein n=1 Tax=Streptomyces sp. NPDC017936 TaxID=3365016 RepID=UPI00379E547E